MPFLLAAVAMQGPSGSYKAVAYLYLMGKTRIIDVAFLHRVIIGCIDARPKKSPFYPQQTLSFASWPYSAASVRKMLAKRSGPHNVRPEESLEPHDSPWIDDRVHYSAISHSHAFHIGVSHSFFGSKVKITTVSGPIVVSSVSNVNW